MTRDGEKALSFIREVLKGFPAKTKQEVGVHAIVDLIEEAGQDEPERILRVIAGFDVAVRTELNNRLHEKSKP